MSGSRLDADIENAKPVNPDDRERLGKAENDVNRPHRGKNIYVSGEVERPKTINVGEQGFATLKEVLENAGGLTTNAPRTKIFIVRGTELYIISHKIGNFGNIRLLPGDFVLVPHTILIGR